MYTSLPAVVLVALAALCPQGPAAKLGLCGVLGRELAGFGLVVDEEGTAIADAEVRLTPPLATCRSLPAACEAPWVYLTDAAGRFEAPVLEPGRYDLEVRARGFAPATVPGLEIGGAAREVDLGTVILVPGAEIAGRVVDPWGAPVAEAEVRVGAGATPRARSDAAGDFTITDLRPGERFVFSVSRPGYVTTEQAGARAPSEEPVVVVLDPGSRLSGRVVDQDELPIAGARVRVGNGGRSHGAVSDEAGRFEIADVAPGPISVSAFSEGYPPAELSGLRLAMGEDLSGVEIVLERGATIEGRVLGPDGDGVAGASVAAEPVGDDDVLGGVSLSGEDGLYRMLGVRPGFYRVVAQHDEFLGTARELAVEEGTNVLDLELGDAGAEVRGRVVDAAGRPVGTASLLLADESSFEPAPSATSGADGSFVFRAVREGSYTLMGAKEGYASGRSDQPVAVGEADVTGLELVLERGATVAGRILGVDFDELARLDVAASGPGGTRRGTVDYEGRYRVEGLGPGEWRVAAELAESGRRAAGRVVLAAGSAEARLDLELAPGFVLSGSVVRGAEPVSGARISLSASGWRSGRVRSDHTGAFRLEGVPGGSYQLTLFDAASAAWHTEEIEVRSDRETVIELASSGVSGRLHDLADGAPIAGAELHLERLDGDVPARFALSSRAASDANGFFRIASVPEGTYRLVAEKGGYAPVESKVYVEAAAEVAGLEITMEAAEGLSFAVVLASGRVPAIVDVAVADAAGRTVASGFYDTTDGGRVRVPNVPAGEWEVSVSAAASSAAVFTASAPGRAGRIVLEPGGDLVVRVPELTGDATPATVMLLGPDGRPYRTWGPGHETVAWQPLRGGRFEAWNLNAGTWSIAVAAEDGRTWNGSAVVAAGTVGEVSLD